MLQLPARGEIWHANFQTTQGGEQNWDRPCLVVSITPFNQGTSDLVRAPAHNAHRSMS